MSKNTEYDCFYKTLKSLSDAGIIDPITPQELINELAKIFEEYVFNMNSPKFGFSMFVSYWRMKYPHLKLTYFDVKQITPPDFVEHMYLVEKHTINNGKTIKGYHLAVVSEQDGHNNICYKLIKSKDAKEFCINLGREQFNANWVIESHHKDHVREWWIVKEI